LIEGNRKCPRQLLQSCDRRNEMTILNALHEFLVAR
jgi:hypothetical protein